jgi:Ca-activated chloride channel family protein
MPFFFWLGLLLPVIIFFYWRNNNLNLASIKVPSIKNFSGLASFRTSIRHLPFVLRLLALSALIIAMARPQTKNDEQQAEGEGVDIVLCLDVSGSMTAQDFTPNRMEAAKKVAADFIDRRLTDRIAIVIFSGESFTQCPLTTDRAVLKSAVESIRNGLLEDGTAIGDGLSTSVDRLRSSKTKSINRW